MKRSAGGRGGASAGSRGITRGGSYSGPGDEEEDERGYAWEDKFVGSWKNVVENEEGGLEVHRADEVSHDDDDDDDDDDSDVRRDG